MDGESPREKLLEACGVPAAERSKQGQKQALDPSEALDRFRQVLEDSNQAHKQWLRTFIREELPPQVARISGAVMQNAVAENLRSLQETSSNAAVEIVRSRQGCVVRFSWFTGLAMLVFLVGLLGVSIGFWLCRRLYVDQLAEEAMRYQIYGRKVETAIQKCPPKEREKLYRLVGGKP
ncbi:MAG TPA: hypothetical protein VJ550_05620 [Geomonas sp.]|nr:hypothetical protein [Geomonas sp.]